MTIKTPRGSSIEVDHIHHGVVLTGPLAADGDRLTVVVSTGGRAEKSVGEILGALWDTILEIAGALKKLLGSCTPQTTTQVNLDKNGNVTSVVVTTTCVPD